MIIIENNTLLTSDSIQMLVASLTHQGSRQLQPIEVERFLNALTRMQSGIPTGITNVIKE